MYEQQRQYRKLLVQWSRGLEQVVTNLLDNAIKYSPECGAIEVGVTLPTNDALEIAIRDHGPGVPPEKRSLIVERFYEAHDNGHKSGLGLGLYVSREIVELHLGHITAEFPSDGGSRFVVDLPLTHRCVATGEGVDEARSITACDESPVGSLEGRARRPDGLTSAVLWQRIA